MRARTLPIDLALHAEDAFARAAREAKVELRSDEELRVVLPDGSSVPVTVKAMAVPSSAQAASVASDARPGGVLVLVADQISADARAALDQDWVGWFDRRGHLRLAVPKVMRIDVDVPPQPRFVMNSSLHAPIVGRSGLAAAAALLLEPENPKRVSEIARIAGLNASSITRAMKTLAAAHLVEQRSRGDYRALVPELFWALADVWPRESVTIRAGGIDVRELHLAKPDLSQPGWAQAGVLGAIAWNAPLVATADYTRHWYVPSEQEVRRLATMYEYGTGDAWQLSADPIGLITHERFGSESIGWPFAHPLFCALDLTASARDREALEQWNPPEGFTRVW